MFLVKWVLMMVHAKNYETVSTFVKVMQKKPWPLFFRTWSSVTVEKLQGRFTMSSNVQLSGNEMLNKKVLSSRWKVRNDEAVHRDTGRVLNARAVATGNARSPRLIQSWWPGSTNKVDVEPDLRRRHASIPDVKCSVSARYDRALPCMTAVSQDT